MKWKIHELEVSRRHSQKLLKEASQKSIISQKITLGQSKDLVDEDSVQSINATKNKILTTEQDMLTPPSQIELLSRSYSNYFLEEDRSKSGGAIYIN
jgi:hypothetical protein